MLLALTLPAAACDKGQLKGVEAEVKPHNQKLDLPAVPPFDLPKPYDANTHAVKELRVAGKQYLGNQIQVHGYVTWIFDCATAMRTADQKDADIQKAIETGKVQCQSRPTFYIGDDKNTPIDHSLWVTEVPRKMREYESKNLSKEQKAWQDRYDKTVTVDYDGHVVPPVAIGDEVIVTGKFELRSTHSMANSEGLIEYKTMKNITQNWTEPSPKPNAGPGPDDPPPADPNAPGPATKQAPPH